MNEQGRSTSSTESTLLKTLTITVWSFSSSQSLSVRLHPAASSSFIQASVNTKQAQLMCSCCLFGSGNKRAERELNVHHLILTPDKAGLFDHGPRRSTATAVAMHRQEANLFFLFVYGRLPPGRSCSTCVWKQLSHIRGDCGSIFIFLEKLNKHSHFFSYTHKLLISSSAKEISFFLNVRIIVAVQFSLFCIAQYHKLQIYLRGHDSLYTYDLPDL